MAGLKDAQARLDKALARLEKASAAPREGSDGGDDQLRRELASARQRCDALEGRTREVSERLDSAIGQIRNLLES